MGQCPRDHLSLRGVRNEGVKGASTDERDVGGEETEEAGREKGKSPRSEGQVIRDVSCHLTTFFIDLSLRTGRLSKTFASLPVVFGEGILMDTQNIHQSGCARSVHPGVGVEPGGLTSPGGGSRPRRDPPPEISMRLFTRLSMSVPETN